MMQRLNLDQKAAQYAQKIVKNGNGDAKGLENLVTRTLGVLQEQGVYAMMLFLYSRSEKEQPIAQAVRESLRGLLDMLSKEAGVQWKTEDNHVIPVPQSALQKQTAEEVLGFCANVVATDLDTLLLVRELYEQTLIYARYGAKAAGG